MAGTYRSSVVLTSAAAATITPTFPTGWQPGDIIGMQVGASGAAGAISTPAGWTAAVAELNDGGVRDRLYYRKMVTGDTAPAWTATTAAQMYTQSTCVQGTNLFWSVATGVTTASGTTHAATGATAKYANAFCGTMFTPTNNTATWTPPSGETERQDGNNGEINDEIVAAGATGNKTATSSTTLIAHAFLFLIEEQTYAGASANTQGLSSSQLAGNSRR